MTAAGLHLIVRLAGERVALPAAAIESVIELDRLTPVPRAAPHVAGLAALRSKVLTVIDGTAALGLPPRPGDRSVAVLLHHEGHAYALCVDAVEDAVDIAAGVEPFRVPPPGGWGRAARGVVQLDGATLVVVAVAALLAGPPAAAAA